MKRIGMGLVGAGFVGPHHVDAVRRLGFVDVVAIAGSSEESGQAKAEALGARKGYGNYQALLDDPDVQVVHNATPNHLHYAVTSAALAKGKHVVSDKPLALSAAQAKKLVNEAQRAGVVAAVTFNYRGNPLVQQARLAVARGDIGTPHFLHGHYLQDWLFKDTDYSWRLEPEKGGRSLALADIGSHWCDLAQHVAGLRITHVLGDLATVVKKRTRPHEARAAFQGGHGRDDGEVVDVGVEDLASVLIRFENGARGCFSVGEVCAGHKNDLVLEICGGRASLRWQQEKQNELWVGHRDQANEVLQKDPSLLDADARAYAHLPGGHQEAWADAFCNLMREIYRSIANGPPYALPPIVATFEDGFRANRIVDAILESAADGGAWTRV